MYIQASVCRVIPEHREGRQCVLPLLSKLRFAGDGYVLFMPANFVLLVMYFLGVSFVCSMACCMFPCGLRTAGCKEQDGLVFA